MGRVASHGIEFRLLGTVEVVAGDRVVEIGSPKQRTLLAALLLRLNMVVPADVLADELWGEAPPPSAQATLQSLVSRLRRALETTDSTDSTRDDTPRLRSKEGGYVLEAAADRVDSVRFDRLVAEGRRALAAGDAPTAVERLEAALALWRGPAFGDLADHPFARLEAHRLEEARVAAVEDLAEALLAVGRAQDALARLERHVAEHPLRERPWGQMMLALYRVGRQADALRAFQHLRHILGEQLGVEPTPELRRLEEQILRQSADLGAPLSQGPAAAIAASRPTADMVAFLFTDIEASTRRWESDQEAMASDLATHDALILEAVEAHGGEAFSHTGDGFCVAFPTVPAAMAAAVTVQQRLLETAWSSPAPLKVRMAVHAGAAERRAENWFGPTLNRTARLMATAAGGQVVCSHVAAELGNDDVPAGISLIDLGEHRLADLTRPERVYQVTHPDLARDFPPLRSLDARRHNLPVGLTSFVGREQELDEVVGLLGTSRLVTLVGTGGAGKTRLALQAAAAAIARFPDGAWFVELAPLRDPDLVVTEVVTTLGFLPSALVQPGESLEERLCDQLQARRLLLVLDNCEHVVEAAARLAHTVLARCRDVTVLATSREVLGVPAEVVWSVPPLSMPPDEAATAEELAGSDAVMLFCERARAAQAGFGLSDANAAAVARICRRLDGIPLGLELAAAKIRVLGAVQVAERLDDRFRLLTGGFRTAVPRHQTLQAAMDWGYTLLPASEQVVLRRLAVFRGSFSLAAVEAVVGADVDVVELLSRLVDKSMVSVSSDDPEVRYRLLETVREYAGQRLGEAGETDEVRTRHRDFYLGLADRWAGRTSYWDWWLWIRQISADDDNFAAALEWSSEMGDHDELLRLAVAHWPYWYWGEALGWRDWLPRAINGCDTPSPARVEGLIALTSLRMRAGEEYQQCAAGFQEARDVAVGLGRDQLVAQVNFYESHALLSLGDTGTAETLLHDALRRSHIPDFIGWCHWGLGWIALLADQLDDAAREFETALRLADQVGDQSMLAHVRPALALVGAFRGDHDAARAIAAEGITSAERTIGAPRVLMMALARAAEVAIMSGDGSAAAPVARLLRLQRDRGVTYWADEALAVAALLLADRLPEEAAVILNASHGLQDALNDTGSQLGAMRGRLRQCRHGLVESLGQQRWDDAEQRGRTMSTGTAIVSALAALESFSSGG
ncbi:MAG TPA: BTAD domain-containing putative transcriptional regulator [Acidimicrobiia bacterium]|nr:BTAD domain-containing putative transcriptional regulator [Acidimicrobiia bacterium]